MTKTLRPLIYHDHHESCPKCNALDSLELFDNYNRPFNYQMLLSTHDTSKLINRSFRYFKCNKCKEIFKIDWTGCVPVPMKISKMEDFIEVCKALKEKEKTL